LQSALFFCFSQNSESVHVSMERKKLIPYLNSILSVHTIHDESCNGLQVEGSKEIFTVGLAVDACLSVFKKAAARKCQLLVVHHGIIWRGLTSITGITRRQIEYLLKHDLNLYAAHLPLDLHAEFGNNIRLADILGLSDIQPFGIYKGIPIGFMGNAPHRLSADDIGSKLQSKIGGVFSKLPFGKRKNRKIALVSGGGSDVLPEAIEKGVDCLITGESTHWNHHMALEGKINVLYCGHYHTETLGVKAIGKHLEKVFKIKTVFIDEPTLV
jgi:dinuclear metal center YbgI/SA1388 family protein